METGFHFVLLTPLLFFLQDKRLGEIFMLWLLSCLSYLFVPPAHPSHIHFFPKASFKLINFFSFQFSLPAFFSLHLQFETTMNDISTLISINGDLSFSFSARSTTWSSTTGSSSTISWQFLPRVFQTHFKPEAKFSNIGCKKTSSAMVLQTIGWSSFSSLTPLSSMDWKSLELEKCAKLCVRLSEPRCTARKMST